MLMELHLPLFPVLFTFLIILFMAIKRVRKSKTRSLIPGPHKLPLIGNLHQLAGSLPHRRLTDLARKHGPIMHLQMGETSTVVVSSPEFAAEIMKTHDTIFAYRPALVVPRITTYEYTDIAFAPYGSYWRQLRKICMSELLSASRVSSFQSIRAEEVSKLIKSVAQANDGSVPVNLGGTITARAAFGKQCKDQEAFISIISTYTKISSGFVISEFFPSLKVLDIVLGTWRKVEKIHGEADRIFENIINDHRESRAKAKGTSVDAEEDLVDVLLRLQEEGQFTLTDNNIKAVIMVSQILLSKNKGHK